MTKPGLIQLNRDNILAAVAAGKSTGQIAKDIGVDRRTISRQLATDPEYQDAVQAYHDSRLEHAEALLEEAATHDDVPSRAGRANAAAAYWRSVSWRAERLDNRYAAKQELTVEHVNMADAISRGRLRARLIQGEAEQVADEP